MNDTIHGQHAAAHQPGVPGRSFGLAPVGQAAARHAAGPDDGRLPVLGIDIGGTKIAAGVVASNGEVLSSAKVVTAGRADADQLWSAVVEAGEQAMLRAGVERVVGVGCGSAGPMAWPEGVVSPLNLPQWREFPLAARLRERWPNGPVRVHNDAVCVAIAEHWIGSAAGHANALGMVVSTGIGGGLILNGRVDNGGLGNAGHIGHVVADPDGPACVCGGVGCLEAIARGPAIVAWAQGQGWEPPAGQEADGVALLLSAREGNQIAVSAFRRSGEAVGAVLASVAALLDLDVAAIGGGIINAGGFLFGPIQEAFDRHAGLG
ncbi:MAG: ROK family protein, partial [Candidatus Nanopelagicales bacterium]